MTSKKSKPLIGLLNGPNLNLLGERNPEIYGTDTLQDIEQRLMKKAEALGYETETFQSNSEGDLIDKIHDLRKRAAGLIINPGGYSHSSVALRDAVETFVGPVIEVHLSNIHAREEYRKLSLISEVASGVICGLGPRGYDFALEAVIDKIENTNEKRKA